MNELTPYDTGERLDPKLWTPLKLGNGNPEGRREDWGKVDFDDDEGATIATVWVERVNGAYLMHVVPFDDTLAVVVVDE